MKEHPILFGGPMVRAILDGRKTQTRRPMKPQPKWRVIENETKFERTGWWWIKPNGCGVHSQRDEGEFRRTMDASPYWCPLGEPGDRLWVRETWADVNTEGGPAIAYRAGGMHFCADDAYPVEYERYPGCEFSMWITDLLNGADGHAWRPSIHMPRWASRITLEVTEVRVERLQVIAPEDALAEGVWENPPDGHGFHPELVPAFRELWDSIYAGRGLGWDANPWVFVTTFRRLEPR